MLIVLILKVDILILIVVFLLDENSAEIFDGLSELESSVPEGTKMVLVYIVGYIARNDSGSSEEKLWNETNFYRQKYRQYQMLWIEVDWIYLQITLVSGHLFVLYILILLNRKFLNIMTLKERNDMG